MFQFELIIWIISTLCIIIIPCIRLGKKLFAVSEKIDDSIQQEVDKIALQEQKKYDLIHDKYVEQTQLNQSNVISKSRFEDIDDLDDNLSSISHITHLTDNDVVWHMVDNEDSIWSLSTPASTKVSWSWISSDIPTPSKNILDQPQITVSGKTLDDQLRDKKSKSIAQIKQTYRSLMDKTDTDAMERKLLEWMALDPEDRDFNIWLADLYFWTHNNKKALSLLKKNLEHNPKEHRILWQMGEIYLRQEEYDQAQIVIAQALNQESNNPKYYMSQAEILYKTQDVAGAVYAIQQAIKLRPNNQDYLHTLAQMYELLNDFDQAKKIYYRLLELDPRNGAIKEKIASL